jgi:hypothetical protein
VWVDKVLVTYIDLAKRIAIEMIRKGRSVKMKKLKGDI